MIGQTLAHYRITAALGAGGMGEVYRATDTRLGRDVALKVLPASRYGDADRLARFRREATTIAALNHPNIVTIFSVEEDNGMPFLTMELVEGRTLDALLPAGGMPLDQLFDVVLPIADAIASAHGRGVVHRDLKPANVMVTDEGGRVKVLDFGLAKVPASEAGTLDTQTGTKAGTILGTPHYMSPEQARCAAVDHRSDIFSLGVLLFEMATGTRPFTGDSSVEVLSAVLKDAPPALGNVKPELPRHLGRIIDRCLEKAPADRYQTARDVYNELRALRKEETAAASDAVPGAGNPRMLAVLPFVNRGGNPDDDYFSDGLAEELINALGALRGVKVIARSSSFQFRGQERDVREIGRRLGVGTVLEGSVRVAKDRLRITVELVNCASGYQIWSQRYDRQMTDVFETQDEIVAKVIAALKVPLGVDGPEPAREQSAPNLDAYHLYLKGRHLRYTKLHLPGALECFSAAAERDPSFAAAHIAVAEAHVLLATYHVLPPRQGLAIAADALRRARELGDDSAELWTVEGLIALSFEWDVRAGSAHLLRALELNPSHSPARAWYALANAVRGRTSDAREHLRFGQERDPLSPYVCAMAAATYLQLGQHEDALTAGRQALELEPDSLLANWCFGLALAACSEWDDALARFERGVKLSGGLPAYVGMRAWAEAASGRHAAARQTLAQLAVQAATRYVSPLFFAWALSELGDVEDARAKLVDTFSERSPLLAESGWPLFRKLRDEPLMARLVRHLRAADGLEFTP